MKYKTLEDFERENVRIENAKKANEKQTKKQTTTTENGWQRIKKAGEVVEAFGLTNEKLNLFVTYINKVKKTDKTIFCVEFKKSTYTLNDTIIKQMAKTAFVAVEELQNDDLQKQIYTKITNGCFAVALSLCGKKYLQNEYNKAQAKKATEKAIENAKKATEKEQAKQSKATAKFYSTNAVFATNLI